MPRFFLITLLLFGSYLQAQSPVKIGTRIEKVTVFQQGAQVEREGSVYLAAGAHTLIFNDLTQNLDASSIRLKTNGAVKILSVSFKNNFLSEEDLPPVLKDLKQQSQELQNRLLRLQAEEEALVAEKNMILANQKIGGGDQVILSVEQLSEMASFFKQRLKAINLALLDNKAEQTEITEARKKVLQQLQQEREAYAQRTGQVLVSVDVLRSSTFEFDLLYRVYQVGWKSSYDVRVSSLDKPVELTHKAIIHQKTGEDWKDVELVLATGNPAAGAQVPYMDPWYINLQSAMQREVNRVAAQAAGVTSNADVRYNAPGSNDEMLESVNLEFKVNQNLTLQEFRVNRKQSVPSSSAPATVVLRELELPAKYEYHAKPRLDKDAFLIAKIYDWNQYDLLEGELALFNNDTYVGNAYLHTQNPEDTLQLSLGRDQNVIVKRTRVYSKQEKSFFGNQRIDHYLWKIEVRNTKKTAINLVLRDQIPVSQNEKIKVDVNRLSGGKLDEKTGIIKWRFTLAPGKNVEKEVSYEVKYPQDQQISLY